MAGGGSTASINHHLLLLMISSIEISKDKNELAMLNHCLKVRVNQLSAII